MATTKSMIDMGLGTAITCSFAIPEAGPAIASVLASGKLLFDLFYPDDKTGGDPMTRLVNQADLKVAMAGLEQKLVHDIWAASQIKSTAKYEAMVTAINDAIKNAGATKTASKPMPGDTTVWLNGQPVKLWNPIVDNPAPLQVILDQIELKDDEKFRSIGLYTMTFGTYLLYCKTAMIFEVNENLKNYQSRKSDYDKAVQNHNYWQLTKQGPEPSIPEEPELPTDGAFAVGSETYDVMTKTVNGFRSHLGKAKGEDISKFATMAKTELSRRTKYLEQVIKDWGIARADRQSYVEAFEKMVTVQATSGGYKWVNSMNQTEGDVTDISTAKMQAAMEKAKITGPKTDAWNKAHTNPDDLTQDDIDKLKTIGDKWKDSVKELGQAGKSGAPAAGNKN